MVKKQTLNDFWNGHRIGLIILGIIFTSFIIYTVISYLYIPSSCIIDDKDKQYYKNLMMDFTKSTEDIFFTIKKDYPYCDLNKLMRQIRG